MLLLELLLERRRHASGVFFFAWPISTPKHVPLNGEREAREDGHTVQNADS